MKYKIEYPKTERTYFKPQKSIFSKIYDRFNQFTQGSYHDPNEIYLGPKAYHDLMTMASKNTPVINDNSFSDVGLVMGMKVKVSSHLMNNEMILLRRVE